jgi:hypothetical protein
MRIDLAGGRPQTIVESIGSGPSGLAWGSNDVIVFTRSNNDVIYRVSADGGEAVPVTSLDRSRGEIGHTFPSFLPDGDHFVYLARSGGFTEEITGAIHLGSLGTGESRLITEADSKAVYAGSPDGAGYLLFVRDQTLWAQAFDDDRLELVGQPAAVSVGDVVPAPATGGAPFTVSANGDLAYVARNTETRLTWMDREGVPQGIVDAPSGQLTHLEMSPDATRFVASVVGRSGEAESNYLFDIDAGGFARLSSPQDRHSDARWSADGR